MNYYSKRLLQYRMSNRRVSLPALRVSTPRTLSPKYFNGGYLEEISEFDVEPPFFSPSSSSSAENSPRMPENRRPGSARPCRRRKRLSKTTCMDEDVFPIDTNYYNPEPKISSTRTTSRSDYGSSNSANISPMDKTPEMEIGSLPTSNRSPRLPLSNMQQMRSFNIDGSGKIVDCGFHYGRISTKPLTPRMSGSRRATCPEIWLSRELEKKDAVNVALRIYGSETVGKKSLIRQMSAHADISGKYDESSIGPEDLLTQSRTINFMMNDKEIELDIIHGSGLGKDLFDEVPTIYLIMYSVDNRESFAKAAQTMFRLYGNKSRKLSVLLVGNKIDLQRKRKVTSIEGKMLSKIYKCGFIEISVMLTMNMDSIWKEIIRKIQPFVTECDRINERRESRGTLKARIVERGRRFAKSCETLVAKIF